jgi:hypothetical protein
MNIVLENQNVYAGLSPGTMLKVVLGRSAGQQRFQQD